MTDAVVEEAFQKVKFLLEMGKRFEAEGNVVESIKSVETALLLRRNTEAALPRLATKFAASLEKDAQDLVLKCNSIAVEEFQQNQYDTASFLLNKALFLTDEYDECNLFRNADHDRTRLRAATYNNLGCLEKRRGRLQASLDHLQRAAQLEVTVDPDVGASPSTYLNLCTVLNKLGNHIAAASAAQRAVDTLKFQEQQGADLYPNFAIMLSVAYYNLGVSLESCERPGDVARAVESYSECLENGRRRKISPTNNTLLQAADALGRLQRQQPGSMVPVQPSGPARPANRLFAISGASAPEGAGASGALFPVPPPSSRGGDGDAPYAVPGQFRVPQLAAARGPATPGSSFRSGKLDDAALRHAERIQARQRKKQADAERDQIALQRAQRAHIREKEEKLKREREAEAARREEMAKALYDKMVHGLRAEEIKRVKNAARKIQKVWRGFLARALIRRLQWSAVRLQSCIRSWLCRVRLRRTEEERQQQVAKEAQLKRQLYACQVIQRHARRFLNRLEIIRQYRARRMRRWHSAARIQRVFRRFCRRREQRIHMQLESERRADERRSQRQNDAARRIQAMFRSFKMRRITRIVALEQRRRSIAATKVQALVRGILTRVWFKHYRLYRRQQELSSSKNLRTIIKIQAVWRCACARKELARRVNVRRHEARQQLLFRSARRIQCAFRCYLARQRAQPLRLALQTKRQAIATIQQRYRAYKDRCAYVKRRDAHRAEVAAATIQRWYRERVIMNKHKETARYHADIQRRQRIALLRTQGALLLQSVLRNRLSCLIVDSMRSSFLKLSRVALAIQNACRGYAARKEMVLWRTCAKEIDEQRRVAMERHRASCIIQRATRCYLAKCRVELMRIRRAASLIISKTYRMHLAQLELRRLKAERRRELETRSARSIQRLARKFLHRLELRRLDEFYSERNRQKLAMMRREEAAITIQAIWRGHATRRETAAERNRLLQNTIDAIRIQRQFRAYRFRRQINAEIVRRHAVKKARRVSAVRIQSFWRAVLAREYVNVVREKRYHQTVCAIAIQCAWRRFRAIRELKQRRAARLARLTLKAKQHDLYMDAITQVATHLRTRGDCFLRLRKLKTLYITRLTEKQRQAHLLQWVSATKIQALYRGHYERTYARGLRREKREREAREAELERRRQRVALCIQLAWRCAVARQCVREKRTAKQEALIASQIQQETVADPHDLVKRLFWSHEAHTNRNLHRERLQRARETNAAVLVLQRNARMWLAMRRYRKRREVLRQEEAAARIQAQWREKQQLEATRSTAARSDAAMVIQALIRGVLTRKHWRDRQKNLVVHRGSAVLLDDLRDQAAMRIQSSWRMCSAKSRAAAIRARKIADKEAQLQNESARLIQKTFRGHYARTRTLVALRAARGNAGGRVPQ